MKARWRHPPGRVGSETIGARGVCGEGGVVATRARVSSNRASGARYLPRHLRLSGRCRAVREKTRRMRATILSRRV